MRLLSRNAESLFWLARYLERGASLARVIEMQSSFGGQDRDDGWSWLLALHSDEARFRERFEISLANIIAFYVTDSANPGSIRSSIHWARENARSLRPFIPLEMWVQLNAFHGSVEAIALDDIRPAQLPRTCEVVRAGCLAQIGIAEGTLYRDEGYEFFRLGLLVERADQTSRLLDVKFARSGAVLRPADPSSDFVFWSTILRTAAAYQVFHRLEPSGADPQRVARFLIRNASHPRSIAFCVREIRDALRELHATFRLTRAVAAEKTALLMLDGLRQIPSEGPPLDQLHAFNDWVQRLLIVLTEDVTAAFFRPSVPEAGSPAAPGGQESGASSSQSQSQSQAPSEKQPRGQGQA